MNLPAKPDEQSSVSVPEQGVARGRLPRAVALRAALFLVLWFVLAGAEAADLFPGAVATAAATWTLPPGRSVRSPAAIARLAFRFFYQSVIAGADVARRALDPRLPLRPGFIVYPVRFRPGTARNVFTTLTSLLPGTVPTGEDNGHLVYHCLDVDQPVASQLAAEESALSRTFRDD
jgi:multicomponent Na+:H+ antiporter subunit E